jgi:hypothetical protein
MLRIVTRLFTRGIYQHEIPLPTVIVILGQDDLPVATEPGTVNSCITIAQATLFALHSRTGRTGIGVYKRNRECRMGST